LLVPDDFKRTIPEEFKDLPALQGRAEVEMVIKKPDGSQYDVDGKLYDQVYIYIYIYIFPIYFTYTILYYTIQFYDHNNITLAHIICR
jgi:hypothetical protein